MKTQYKKRIDTNGNSCLLIKTGTARATSIQTNGNLPKTHRDGIGEWTPGEVETYQAATNGTVGNRALLARIESKKAHGAWRKGVKQYAMELVESAEVELTRDNLKSVLLNGAETWGQYSYGGCSLIYDADIAERLCSPSEYKRKREGEAQPSPRETWLDCQARALWQAASLIKSLLA
jgi:hypothetical protein